VNDRSAVGSPRTTPQLSPSRIQHGLGYGQQHGKAMPPQFQVVKVFPQRGYLCLHRLVKPATFTCNRCSLGKTSKLVAFAKDKWDEPMCNGCYGYLLAASEINDCVKSTQDNLGGVTACAHSRRSLKSRRASKSARRDRKSE
jgi:hypothetical protein